MLGVLPKMAGEAPPGYVAFVERNLELLRRDATRVLGDADDADRLYPEVLTDVAARWSWLELARTRLGRPGAADSYLHQAFSRRSERWRARWQPVAPPTDALAVSDIRVLRPGAPLPLISLAPDRPAPPSRLSSAAARQAVYTRSTVRTEVRPLAEAAIAWWHAYEARRRRLLITALVVALLLVLAALRVQQATDAGGWS